MGGKIYRERSRCNESLMRVFFLVKIWCKFLFVEFVFNSNFGNEQILVFH